VIWSTHVAQRPQQPLPRFPATANKARHRFLRSRLGKNTGVRYNRSGPCFSMKEATSELLADANDIVREQLALAWREHIERVRDVLEAQWPERMERVLEETVAGLAARLEEEHQDALKARVQQANRSAETARRELIRKLNQITRRLRSFENERQWSNTLVDATRGFCGRAALFLIRDR
jgi:hypothetical protein